MNWLAPAAAAAVLLVNPVPPQARAALKPLVPTPAPRVSPPTVRLAALVVGDKGETPKFVCPLTSQPTNVSLAAGELMLMTSLAVLLAGLASLPPETATVLVALAGALDATFTVTVRAG